MLVKNNIAQQISTIDCKSDCILWLNIHKNVLGYNFIIGAVYIPHEGSIYYDNDVFDTICSDIINLNSKYDIPICLTGDFNARTGVLQDFVSLEEGVNDFDLPLINCLFTDSNEKLDSLGINITRSNSDKKTNNNGSKLIELCKIFDLRILNGRIGNDCTTGDFTCVSSSGKSTVDYTIVSSCLLPKVKQFNVGILDTCLSDKHKTIYTVLLAENTPSSVISTTISTSSKPKYHSSNTIRSNSKNTHGLPSIKTNWKPNKSDDYKGNFDYAKLDLFHEKLNNIKSNDINQIGIDDITSTLCNLLITPAVKIGVAKEMNNNNNRYNRTNSHKNNNTENKPWFNKYCERMRSNYIKIKNKLSKDKTVISISKLKYEARKYKQTLKKAKKDYYKELATKIRNLRSTDPKAYWNIINKADNKPKNMKCHVEIDNFFHHFNNLGNDQDTANVSEDDFDPREIKHSLNDLINNPISIDEINEVRKKLKNNKSCGPDSVTNEFIKNCPPIVIDITAKLFNIVLDSGIIPKMWCLGYIIPIYKNKGSVDDPNNYRGITLLSCIGKLFTAVLNARLTKYLDGAGIIGEDQAGFRANYSTMDHVFSLHCIIDLYLRNKKRLYCAFVDYKKAFDLINRSDLWSKLIANGINGKVITVIYNLYKEAKSCVKSNNTISNVFSCNVGVRQGENLSPLLFAIFLNDLESSLRRDGVSGLNYINSETIKHLSDDDVEIWLRLYVLLYADDTIILSESAEDLQKALNSLHIYCKMWHLTVNSSKTKVVIFSRGKIRLKPSFSFGTEIITICDDYTYLGVVFNFNGNFKKAIAKQVSQAKHAMFALLTKAAKLHLPIDITCDLFDKLVLPILLYGCEVWGFEKLDHIEIFYRNFLRRVLKVNKLTVNCMLYGEVGKYKLANVIYKRMVNFWSRIITGKESKYSFRLFNLIKCMHDSNSSSYTSKWIIKTKEIIDLCGFSNIWILQNSHNPKWFKNALALRISDIDKQNWSNDVENNRFCHNYRIFKSELSFQFYLSELDFSNRLILTKLRCSNIKIPNNMSRFSTDDTEKKCKLCCKDMIGDEFHYLFICSFFETDRSKYIQSYLTRQPNAETMSELFNSKKVTVLNNLCSFAKNISLHFLT